MNLLGVIAEYNPFHNGHKHHLRMSIQQANASHTIVLMSGSIVQRGSFSVTYKWQRAKMALENGADLVCELPFVYASQSAERFAQGAVRILDSCGVDFLSFGVENHTISQLQPIAQLLANEPPDYVSTLKRYLNDGLSYPSARSHAIADSLGLTAQSILNQPNTILAIEYLKAIYQLNSTIQPIAISRTDTGYNSTIANGSLGSATAIRSAMHSDNLDMVQKLIPYNADILSPEIFRQQHHHFCDYVITRLLSSTVDSLRNYPDISEGLEFSLLNALNKNLQYDKFVSCVSSKRIPTARIRRILMNIAMDFQKTDLGDLTLYPSAPYLRVLGMNGKGREILRHISDSDNIPIITNLHSNRTKLNAHGFNTMKWDIRATNLHAWFRNDPQAINADYRQQPIIIKE